MNSLLVLLGLPLTCPDYTLFSKGRGRGLQVAIPRRLPDGPVNVVVDSTGLKVFGEGEWKVRQHGVGKRRTWRNSSPKCRGEGLCNRGSSRELETAGRLPPTFLGRDRHVVGISNSSVPPSANLADTKSGCDVLKAAAEKHGRLKAFSGDEGYRGSAVEFVQKILDLKLHISKKIKDTFAVLPIRWIVERTFAWLGNYRRLSKDYEIRTRSVENMIRIAMLRITLAKCL